MNDEHEERASVHRSSFIVHRSIQGVIMPNGGKPIVILLADDDEEDRMLAKDALAESRVVNDLRCVEDGDELLDYLYHRGRYAADPAPSPGLILLDLNMPRKDGREALR